MAIIQWPPATHHSVTAISPWDSHLQGLVQEIMALVKVLAALNRPDRHDRHGSDHALKPRDLMIWTSVDLGEKNTMPYCRIL